MARKDRGARKQGKARKEKNTRKASTAGLIVGRIQMNRKGFGFVEADEGDIYVPAKRTGGAMNGDTVGVRLETSHGKKGRSGVVMKVVERSHDSVVGRFERRGALGIVVPTDTRILHDVFVQGRDAEGAENGDIVVVDIIAYPSSNHAMQGVVVEVLGQEGDPGLDIEVIIREHGLRGEFPEDVHADAEHASQDTQAELERGRVDLRDTFTITIDPADAKDFDDAVSIERVDGKLVLGVHIADVSHYVPWDSAIDEEARRRATSVYLVDRVIPMLPEELSNVICSLGPDEDRLTFSVLMTLDSNAKVESYELMPSVIRSDRRFDYDEVQRMLDGDEPYPDGDSKQLLIEFARIAAKIGERRVARGGLDFETVEAKVKLAEDGTTPVGVIIRERTQATNMIEEAMILANEVVAEHMARAEVPMVYRIHEDPDADALRQVAVVLAEFDYPAKEVRGATPRTFQQIIEFAHTRPEKLLINSLLLRALQQARYVDFLSPHFGLASKAYTHFTSPIRRYPDLLVHRLLKAQLEGRIDKPPVAVMANELEWLTEHCSIMEREAESAEHESTKVKLTELMAQHVGEVFDGIITGVHSYGLFVQLDNTAEGLVHVESMADDYYRLDAERFLLMGEDRGRIFRLGQRVRVRILSASVSERRIDLEIA